MSPPPSMEDLLRQISELSQNFRQQLMQGKAARIEDFLHQVSDQVRESLFSSLLEIEVNFRRSRGEPPTSAEYLIRFPQFSQLVRRCFFESSIPPIQSGNANDDQNAPTKPLPISNRLGEYELVRKLGQGGMGVVYEARHTPTENRVALKTLINNVDGLPADPNRLHRFRKEFRSLSEVNHPNLVSMQTLERDGERWFFTMDLIDGQDFIQYVRPHNQLNEERLRSCLPQLADGIMALHAKRIVHRDLKPGNVLVDDRGHLLILDFGLVAELRQTMGVTLSRTEMFVGTVPYSAPEQMFGERTEANDWYAFGTMLYEALTGKVPFPGNCRDSLLRKQQEDPPELKGRMGIPSDLAELADGLLRRETSERWGVDAVAAFLELRGKTRIQGSTVDSNGSQGPNGAINEESFDFVRSIEDEVVLIGREQQLSQLTALTQDFIDSKQPRAIWITGRSGEGKSSLAEKFLRTKQDQNDTIIFRGRCYELESVPFKAIDCWIDSLVHFLRRQSKSWFQQRLTEDIPLLANIFPALRRVESIQALPPIEGTLLTPEILQHRAFGALSHLLREISKEKPIVLFVDDLQWGDAESVSVYCRLFEGPDPPQILMIGGYRKDQENSSDFLTRWKTADYQLPSSHISVGPLTSDQSLQLLHASMPNRMDLSREGWADVYRESAGNPYLLSQLLDSYDFDSKRFRPVPLKEVITGRLRQLPPEAAKILDVLSVAGHDIPASSLASLIESHSCLATLRRMRNEKLVSLWGSHESPQVDTYHDKIRETRLAALSTKQREFWHLQIAELLETSTGMKDKNFLMLPPLDPFTNVTIHDDIPAAFDLAYHFNEARDPRALQYQIIAGEKALDNLLTDEALKYLERAKDLAVDNTEQQFQFRINYSLGLATLRAGRPDQASKILAETLDFASTPKERARVYYTWSTAEQLAGRVDDAIHYSEQALTELGVKLPKTSLTRAFFFVLDLSKILVFSGPPTPQSDEKSDSVTIAEMNILERLTMQYIESNMLAFLCCVCRLAKVGERAASKELAALTSVYKAFLLSAIGLHKHSHRTLARDLPKEKRPRALNSLALVNAYLAVTHYHSARFKEAISEGEPAAGLAERCGDHRTLTHIVHILRHVHAWSGKTSDELAMANRVLKTAKSYDAAIAICWGWYDLANAQARAGNLPQASEAIKNASSHFATNNWFQTAAIFGGVHAFVRLQCSDPEGARTVLEGTWSHMKRRQVINEFTLVTVPLLLESIVGADWSQPTTPKDRRLARSLTRWSWLLFRSFPTLQSSFLRARGRLFASKGATKRAINSFTHAIRITEDLGMPFYQAKALLDLAAVQEESREENRAEAIRLLKEMESVIPRAEGWLLGDQYDEAVVAPQFDLQAWEEENGPIRQPQS